MKDLIDHVWRMVENVRPYYRQELYRLAQDALLAHPEPDANDAREEHVRIAAARSPWIDRPLALIVPLLSPEIGRLPVAKCNIPFCGHPEFVAPLLIAEDAIGVGVRYWPRAPAVPAHPNH